MNASVASATQPHVRPSLAFRTIRDLLLKGVARLAGVWLGELACAPCSRRCTGSCRAFQDCRQPETGITCTGKTLCMHRQRSFAGSIFSVPFSETIPELFIPCRILPQLIVQVHGMACVKRLLDLFCETPLSKYLSERRWRTRRID